MSTELKAGDPLPSMRKLAKSLHVSVITTQKAYEALQNDGFIITIPAKGTFVSSMNQESILSENQRRIDRLLKDAVAIAKENGITLEELQKKMIEEFEEEKI